MVKQRSIGGDGIEEAESSSQSPDALRAHVMDNLHTAAFECGIILKDLAVIDRLFKVLSYGLLHVVMRYKVKNGTEYSCEITSTMEKLTKRALQAQVEAANIDRENSNKVKQEEGVLSVARIKAQSRNAESDAEAYAITAAAKAYSQHIIAAERMRT